MDHGRIVSAPGNGQHLDTLQLTRLEASFREWAHSAPRGDVRIARSRVLLIFFLIRYAGAKLAEVLCLAPEKDFNLARRVITFRGAVAEEAREVQLSASLSEEVHALLNALPAGASPLAADPAFVRRKFYERATACGFAKHLGGPEKLRKARAVELMQNNMPLPAVQRLLGHSTPNLTSAYVSFSDEDMRRVTRFFVEKESGRKTSARNAFFGKVHDIRKGDLQALVTMATLDGGAVTAIITNSSLERLGLKHGSLLTAEVKAPWIMVQKSPTPPLCSAENCLQGTVIKVTRGGLNTECVVRISEQTEICALLSTPRYENLGIAEDERVWVLFSCSAVVLHTD